MKNYLSRILIDSLHKMNMTYEEPIQFNKPKSKDNGDLSTNLAMLLARTCRKNPRDLAQQICDGLDYDSRLLSKAEIAGAGFINFFFNVNYLQEQLRAILDQQDTYGQHTAGFGKRVNVEFVSANPTGPLSIGHGRQAVLGDVLCRLFENAGYDVTREYYFNNAGLQMKRLGESVRLRYLEQTGEPVAFPEGLYEGEYITDIAAKIREEFGDDKKQEDGSFFRNYAESMLFANIQRDLKNIRLEFNVFFNEDTLYKEGRIQRLIGAFRDKGLVYEKENALWMKTSLFEYDKSHQPEADKVIVKSSGEPTYRLPDMAYHITKFERGFDIIIDIFGADHIAEYPDVLAALKTLGYDTSRIRVLIHQFVTLMKEGELLKMSKRKANFVTIAELVDLLGADVFRYFLVMRSHNSHLNFDLELAVKHTMENPVYYVQNAHARICSIEKKAAEKGMDVDSSIHDADLTLLKADEEIQIIHKLLEFPELTLRLVQALEVHPLTTYLEELAGLYHYYQTAGKKDERLRVITSDKALSASRLALCRAVRITVARGLGILGVEAPAYMSRDEDEN